MEKTRKTISRSEYWQKVIAEQERSGRAVHGFCEQFGIAEQSFYVWRKRLRESAGPVRFALVETGASKRTAEPLELILAGGERLLIGVGVEVATLRTVLEVLRA